MNHAELTKLLYRVNMISSGDLLLTPKRHIKRLAKALGGCLYRDHKHAPHAIDLVLTGNHYKSKDFYTSKWKGCLQLTEEVLNEGLGLFWSEAQRMANLRSLLQGPVTRLAWLQICVILEMWPHDEEPERGVEYVIAAQWPAAIRRALPVWVKRAANGSSPVLLSMCDSLEIDESFSAGQLKLLNRVLSDHEIHTLIIDPLIHPDAMKSEFLESLLQQPYMASLSHLHLGWAFSPPLGAFLQYTKRLKHLQVLESFIGKDSKFIGKRSSMKSCIFYGRYVWDFYRLREQERQSLRRTLS